MRFPDQGQSGECLESGGCSRLCGYRVRDRDCGFGRHGCVFCVCELARISDADAGFQIGGRVGADRGDGAGAFAAEDVGKRRGSVETGSVVAAV